MRIQSLTTSLQPAYGTRGVKLTLTAFFDCSGTLQEEKCLEITQLLNGDEHDHLTIARALRDFAAGLEGL